MRYTVGWASLYSTNRVTSDGIEAFDVKLGNFQAEGQIINQVYKRIAYEYIIGTAPSGRHGDDRPRIRTRPSTLSTGQVRSAN